MVAILHAVEAVDQETKPFRQFKNRQLSVYQYRYNVGYLF